MVKDRKRWGDNLNKKVKGKIKFKPKEKIIRILIEDKEPRSILSLSGSAVLDYKNTYDVINKIDNIVSIKKIGNTNLVELNPVPSPDIYSVENKRTDEFLSKHQKLKIVKKYVEETNYPFMIVLVFGSYTKSTETRGSDIDICIISDNKDKTKELIDKLNLLSLKLEIHNFTIEEFVSMIKTKEKNIGHEIIKSNIILYGIESYYRLISKWMKKE